MLLTKALMQQFQKVWNQSAEKDPIVVCKFFYSASEWTRYPTEFEPETRIFFGYVVGHFPERWYFSLDELESFRWRFGLSIERDRFFRSCRFSELAV